MVILRLIQPATRHRKANITMHRRSSSGTGTDNSNPSTTLLTMILLDRPRSSSSIKTITALPRGLEPQEEGGKENMDIIASIKPTKHHVKDLNMK